MPAAVRAITYIVSSRYYVTALKAIFLKGAGIEALAEPLIALTLYAGVVGFFAMRAFKKNLG